MLEFYQGEILNLLIQALEKAGWQIVFGEKFPEHNESNILLPR